MKLRRQKRKTSQALDAITSMTEIWSDWKPGKQVGKGVKKVKALRPPGAIKSLLSSRRVRVGGAVAAAGAAGAAVFGKLRGKSDPGPVYTGPAPSVAAEAAASDAPPLVVAPEPAAENTEDPAIGAAGLRDSEPGPAEPEPAIGSAGLREAPTDAGADGETATSARKKTAGKKTAGAQPATADAAAAADTADTADTEK